MKYLRFTTSDDTGKKIRSLVPVNQYTCITQEDGEKVTIRADKGVYIDNVQESFEELQRQLTAE